MKYTLLLLFISSSLYLSAQSYLSVVYNRHTEDLSNWEHFAGGADASMTTNNNYGIKFGIKKNKLLFNAEATYLQKSGVTQESDTVTDININFPIPFPFPIGGTQVTTTENYAVSNDLKYVNLKLGASYIDTRKGFLLKELTNETYGGVIFQADFNIQDNQYDHVKTTSVVATTPFIGIPPVPPLVETTPFRDFDNSPVVFSAGVRLGRRIFYNNFFFGGNVAFGTYFNKRYATSAQERFWFFETGLSLGMKFERKEASKLN